MGAPREPEAIIGTAIRPTSRRLQHQSAGRAYHILKITAAIPARYQEDLGSSRPGVPLGLETSTASPTNTISKQSASAKSSLCNRTGHIPKSRAIGSRSGHNRTRVPPRGRRLLGAEAPASAAELSFPDSALRSGVTRVQSYSTAHGTLLPDLAARASRARLYIPLGSTGPDEARSLQGT
jgi:hypothetical protein